MSNEELRFGKGSEPPAADDMSTTRFLGNERRPVRVVAVILLAAALAVAGMLVFLRLFVAERIPELTVATLDQAEERWQHSGPHDYDIDVELRGAQPGTVQAQVRGGQVTSMTRDGRTPNPWTWRYWSVPGMLETLERDLVLAEDPVHETGAAEGTQWQLRCEFDPEFGYPRRYHRFVSAGGPEVYWRVTRFEPK
jgi:hypothetical protein